MERIKAVLLLTVIVVAFGLYTAWGMRPFAGLRAEWIDGAEILPGIPVEGTEELMQGVLVTDRSWPYFYAKLYWNVLFSKSIRNWQIRQQPIGFILRTAPGAL